MKLNEYAPIVLRISFALVILWFGFTSAFNYEALVGYLPSFAYGFGISAKGIMMINGLFEIIFGGLLMIGLFTRISSFLLFLHIIVIMFGLGYNDLAVRDFGLAFASLSVFLFGPDKFCLDKKLKK